MELKNISSKIKYLRQEKELSQKDLANILETTNKNVWAYENEYAYPPIDFLVKLSKFFNVSTDYLLGLEDDFGAKINSGAGTDALSKDEKKLIEDFRHLNVYSRQTILIQVEALAEKETQKN